MHSFCPGYSRAPYKALVADYPGPDAYPPERFRTEWGPVFHRGRLDGAARVLVLGQDPAQHEVVARRILVGTAGRRVQGFLAKLGIESSYVMVNTFLYGAYGGSGASHVLNPAISVYRHRWLDTLVRRNDVAAVVTLGTAARRAFTAWREQSVVGRGYAGLVEAVPHPTYPESAAADGEPYDAALRELLAKWNTALDRLSGRFAADAEVSLVPYGERFREGDLAAIPEADLPAGLPAWMRSDEVWAARKGRTAAEKRATIVVSVPKDARPPVP
jgi:uracil-DNA glycosylase